MGESIKDGLPFIPILECTASVKCKLYGLAVCLTGDTSKCKERYNEWNVVCPYFKEARK